MCDSVSSVSSVSTVSGVSGKFESMRLTVSTVSTVSGVSGVIKTSLVIERWEHVRSFLQRHYRDGDTSDRTIARKEGGGNARTHYAACEWRTP